MIYCCETFRLHVEESRFAYCPIRRYYACYIKDEEHYGQDGYGQCILRHCPFCGARFPSDLYTGDEYYDALEEAVGKEFCDIKEEEIPEEFKSDEWWKKRGL
jgi:hypothetical protein